MREYWWIFVGAILCAIFSKQIDRVFEKFVKDSKKRAVWYCITGVVCLAVMGIFVYMAWAKTIGNVAFLLAFMPVFLFIGGVSAGILFARRKRRKIIDIKD